MPFPSSVRCDIATPNTPRFKVRRWLVLKAWIEIPDDHDVLFKRRDLPEPDQLVLKYFTLDIMLMVKLCRCNRRPQFFKPALQLLNRIALLPGGCTAFADISFFMLPAFGGEHLAVI